MDQERSVGRLEVELSDRSQVVRIAGAGKLVVTGADPKPVSLRAVNGTLEIGSRLEISIAGTRFSANAGGTLVLRGGRILATEPDLKLAISQTGTLQLWMDRWQPGLDLDLSTSRTLGLGNKVIDFALPPGAAQVITFRRFKEHDGDPILIRGFEPGDALRFRQDPSTSTDPGKELVLEAIRFDGWAPDSHAEIERLGEFWYIKPKGSPPPSEGRRGL